MAKPYVIGIDMGGTNTVFGIVDARGNVIASSSIKTAKHSDFNDYIDELHTELTRLITQEDAEGKINGIGIGAPNGNYYTGLIDQAPNLPWPTPIPLAEMVTKKFGIPCLITNDANAAAIGEMTYGVARGMKDFIMITLGTGVGSGIVVNGQMVYGHDGFAGELGHVIVKRTNGRVCGCGRTGCLEAYCSATGVARTAREFLELRSEPSSVSWDVLPSGKTLDVMINSIGPDLEKRLEEIAEQESMYSVRTTLYYLNMNDPGCIGCYEEFRRRGFIFSGCLPGSTAGDFIIMEDLKGYEPDRAHIDPAPGYKEMLDKLYDIMDQTY